MQDTLFPRHWLLLPGLVFLSIFFFFPAVYLFYASFQAVDIYGNSTGEFTGGNYAKIWTDSYYSSSIGQTMKMALQATLVCCVMGYIAGYAIVHARSRSMRAILYAVVISPLLTSVIARSFGWIVLLSRGGVVNETLMGLGLTDAPMRMLYTEGSTIVAVAQVLMPFAVLPIVTALTSMNKDVRKAAAVLGASRARIFFSITLPLTLPGVLTGGLLVFIQAMGIYITPLVVGGPNRPLIAVRIYEQVLSFFNVPQAAALSFVLLLLTLTIAIFVGGAFRKWSYRRLGV